jgi:hypothetical protein
MSAPAIKTRTLLENLLLVMGFGGIGLTALVSVAFIGISFVTPDEGLSAMYGLFLGIVGFTAGIGLIALSQILGYLRIIAAGTSPGKVFE